MPDKRILYFNKLKFSKERNVSEELSNAYAHAHTQTSRVLLGGGLKCEHIAHNVGLKIVFKGYTHAQSKFGTGSTVWSMYGGNQYTIHARRADERSRASRPAAALIRFVFLSSILVSYLFSHPCLSGLNVRTLSLATKDGTTRCMFLRIPRSTAVLSSQSSRHNSVTKY